MHMCNCAYIICDAGVIKNRKKSGKGDKRVE